MFENNYPLFNSGRLLKIEMLEELRDFPREFFDIRLKEYSDGIISGCDIDVTDNYIIIKKGIIKHQDTLYILKEEEKIPYECNNKLMILKVKFLPVVEKPDSRANFTEINLSEDFALENSEVEICRFKLRMGAKLRINHIDFNDLSTEYDTVNIINAPYAAYRESSLNPEILRSFGRELLECNVNDVWNIAFGMICVQSKEPIQKELILRYLIYKLNIKMKNYSNEEIYNYLLNVLNSAKNGQGNNRHVGNGRFKKILID